MCQSITIADVFLRYYQIVVLCTRPNILYDVKTLILLIRRRDDKPETIYDSFHHSYLDHKIHIFSSSVLSKTE